MMYFKTFRFSKVGKDFTVQLTPKINLHWCLDMTYPPAKFDVD